MVLVEFWSEKISAETGFSIEARASPRFGLDSGLDIIFRVAFVFFLPRPTSSNISTTFSSLQCACVCVVYFIFVFLLVPFLRLPPSCRHFIVSFLFSFFFLLHSLAFSLFHFSSFSLLIWVLSSRVVLSSSRCVWFLSSSSSSVLVFGYPQEMRAHPTYTYPHLPRDERFFRSFHVHTHE